MLDNINLEDIKRIALNAGIAIMKIYKEDFSVEYKEDKSPLTKADLKANEIICKSLEQLYPNIPIMSEENKQTFYEIRKKWEYYWCIDPIDGTKEFIKKNDEFTVNIALIHKNSPVLGVVYAPVLAELYYAKKNSGAFKELLNNQHKTISKEKLPIQKSEATFTIVSSKSHLSQETKEFIEELKTQNSKLKTLSKGSSLKLCMVASGEASIYPRLYPTMEWDTAAADAIVREAGKNTYIYENNFLNLETKELKPLIYNKENLLNPWFVVK